MHSEVDADNETEAGQSTTLLFSRIQNVQLNDDETKSWRMLTCKHRSAQMSVISAVSVLVDVEMSKFFTN